MAKNIMKNTYKKSIFGLALVLAFFGAANYSFAGAPTMLTMPQSNVTQTQATLNGTFNSNGTSPMDVRFEYGTTTGLGQTTSYVTKTSASGSYSDTVSGLSPNTTYYFRAMGVNAASPDFGTILNFTTAGYNLPSAITNPAQNVSTNQATLMGTFNGNGSAVDTWFEYSTNSSLSGYSSTSVTSQSASSGNMSATISGLSSNTTYYFRAAARTSGGTKRSSGILSFVTSPGGSNPTNNCVINSFSPSKTSINSGDSVYIYWNTSNCTSATLSPSGYSRLSSTGYIVNPTRTTRYTLNASNGSTSDSRSFTVNITNSNPTYNCAIDSFTASDYTVNSGSPSYLSWSTSNCSSATLSPLGYSATNALRYAVYPTSNTTYRLTGSNGVTSTLNIIVHNNNGGGGGCVGCGSPNNSLKPTVRTDVASDIKSGGAVVHGYAHGKGSNINVWFEYGKTPNLGAVTSTQYGGGATNANGLLGGLSSNTTYYYRLAARNSYGITYGNILSFTTDRSINDYRNTTVTNRVNNNTNNNTNNGTTNSNDNGSVDSYNDENSNGGLSASAGSASFSLIPHTFLGWLILILVIIVGIILVRLLMKNEYHDRGI